MPPSLLATTAYADIAGSYPFRALARAHGIPGTAGTPDTAGTPGGATYAARRISPFISLSELRRGARARIASQRPANGRAPFA